MESVLLVVHHNSAYLITILLLIVAALLAVVIYLLVSVIPLKNKSNNARTWFFEVYMPRLEQTLAVNSKDQKAMFTALWEHFYIILSVRGVIEVDKEKFLENGIRELYQRYPNAENFIKPNEDATQGHLFDMWEDYYLSMEKEAELSEENKH